jgi:hypothetical protein
MLGIYSRLSARNTHRVNIQSTVRDTDAHLPIIQLYSAIAVKFTAILITKHHHTHSAIVELKRRLWRLFRNTTIFSTQPAVEQLLQE